MFLLVIETAITAALTVIMVTQIFAPLINGVPLFPIFRKERSLVAALEKERQKNIDKQIRKNIETERRKREHDK